MKDLKPKIKKIESKLNTLKKLAHRKLNKLNSDLSIDLISIQLRSLDEDLKKLIDKHAK